MGRDYELVAYRGKALSHAEVARVLRRVAPDAELFRHSLGSKAWLKKQALVDLHCVAIYEQVRGASAKTDGAALYFSEGKLAEIQREAVRDDRSLSWIVQSAWKLMRTELATKAAAPASETAARNVDADNPMLELARALSRTASEAFWLLQGDHSGVGGYAQFRRGKLVDPPSIEAVFVDEDYIGIPTRKWSAALGVPVELDHVFAKYFPDRKEPPLRGVGSSRKSIPFDGKVYDIALD